MVRDSNKEGYMTHRQFHEALVAIAGGEYCSTEITVTSASKDAPVRITYSAYVASTRCTASTAPYRRAEDALDEISQRLDGIIPAAQSLDSLDGTR